MYVCIVYRYMHSQVPICNHTKFTSRWAYGNNLILVQEAQGNIKLRIDKYLLGAY